MKKRKSVLLICFLFVCLTALIAVWFVKQMKDFTYSHSSVEKNLHDPLWVTYGEEFYILFQPKYERLDEIAFLFNTHGDNQASGSVTLRIYDSNKQLICTSSRPIKSIISRQEAFFSIGCSMDVNQVYSISLTATDYGSTPLTVYVGSPYTASSEYVDLIVSDTSLYIFAPYTVYRYKASPAFFDVLPYIILIDFAGIVGVCIVHVASSTKKGVREYEIE